MNFRKVPCKYRFIQVQIAEVRSIRTMATRWTTKAASFYAWSLHAMSDPHLYS